MNILLVRQWELMEESFGEKINKNSADIIHGIQHKNKTCIFQNKLNLKIMNHFL